MAAEKLITNNQSFGDELSLSISEVGSCSVLTVEVGAGCEDIASDYALIFITSELINNCAEKKAEDIRIGVSIAFDEATGTYRLVVEDNVSYPPEVLKHTLANLRRKHSQRAGKSEKRTGLGEIGKSMIQNNLERWGGGLRYEATPDRRIVAVAEWSREHYLHPLPQVKDPSYFRTV